MADRTTSYRFFDALFPEVPPDAAVLIWTLRGRRSVWCTSIKDAADTAAEIGDDVYVGACLGPRSIMDDPRSSKIRAKADQVVLMPGLWVDIDFAHDAHQKQNLPPSIEAARNLLDAMPLKPSIIVVTGHGLHGWWLFDEPLDLADDQDRADAARLARGWNHVLRKHAETRGWSVDSVFDLARVMRVPGTRNCKGNEPVDCTILELNDNRYMIDDVDQYIPENIDELSVAHEERGHDAETNTDKEQTKYKFVDSLASEESIAFIVNANASPPGEKLGTALVNDGTFKDTWSKARQDMPDQSLSAYDQSLANQSVAFGWTDQEIVDLLISFRRNHGKPKLRRDYFLMTLTKARRAIQAQEADERIEELAAITQAAAETTTLTRDGKKSVEFRREALKTLTQMFGFRVHAIEKTKSSQPLYSIKTDHGMAPIGRIGAVMSPAIFKQQIADATGLVLGKRKNGTWDAVSQVILNAVTEVDVGPDATEAGAATSWLYGYLSDNPPLDIDANPDAGHRDFYPMLKNVNGEVLICIETRDLRQWIKVAHGYGDRINQRDMGTALRAIGAESRSVRLRAGEATVRRWVVAPRPDIMPPATKTPTNLRIVTPSGGSEDCNACNNSGDQLVTGKDPLTDPLNTAN